MNPNDDGMIECTECHTHFGESELIHDGADIRCPNCKTANRMLYLYYLRFDNGFRSFTYTGMRKVREAQREFGGKLCMLKRADVDRIKAARAEIRNRN